jgi:hypothetical protein
LQADDSQVNKKRWQKKCRLHKAGGKRVPSSVASMTCVNPARKSPEGMGHRTFIRSII